MRPTGAGWTPGDGEVKVQGYVNRFFYETLKEQRGSQVIYTVDNEPVAEGHIYLFSL